MCMRSPRAAAPPPPPPEPVAPPAPPPQRILAPPPVISQIPEEKKLQARPVSKAKKRRQAMKMGKSLFTIARGPVNPSGGSGSPVNY